MEQKIGKILGLFREATGKKMDNSQYGNRLLLQKLVFLGQKLGIDFGYYYVWYLKGPYSVQLASDIFNVENKNNETPLSEKEKDILQRLRKAFGEDLTNEEKLELLGSLVFIKKEWNITQREAIVEKLRSLKPWFSKETTEQMLDKIEKSQLFN
jgi:uncharacterized protein YwgA